MVSRPPLFSEVVDSIPIEVIFLMLRLGRTKKHVRPVGVRHRLICIRYVGFQPNVFR